MCLKNIVRAQIDTENESQHEFELDGEVSAYFSYSPENDLDMFLGGRYLPELNYGYTFKNKSLLDFELSANIYSSALFHPFYSSQTVGEINPYRIWVRYSGEQFEVRLGLQKIDFGTARLLRSLQWFDEVDPRDPLNFTTGVYGILARYYFLNNANIWVWGLYGNENPRGFEPLKNSKDSPEFGGRVQIPVPKGEVGLTYHHRNASFEGVLAFPSFNNIPENRISLDGKWDIILGIWFEAVLINKSKDIGILTNQNYLTIGTDYTFDVGNGLNISFEHLHSNYIDKEFKTINKFNASANSIYYPLGLFDSINSVMYYSWDSKLFFFYLNYEHQFDELTGYVSAFYNPDSQSEVETLYENSFSGPGVRVMLVYYH